ncbi:MAG: DNA translocase FtsK [Candidatus Roizmanbacteria bacterium]|nr:DNA translocase FtsK [Candidatus Roizmanbacteria bacterium]
MNLKLNFGKTTEGKNVEFDLKKDNIHTIFLTGETGTGKSILHYHLYKQLAQHNKYTELGFVFMDMIRVEFGKWKGPYLHVPVIFEPKEALECLVAISENPPKDKVIIIHIEECDMMAQTDTGMFEKAWKKIQESKNIYIIFSTSRPSPDVFTSALKKHTDMVISYHVPSEADSIRIMDKPGAEKLAVPGEKIVSVHGKQVQVGPVTDKEFKELQIFEKYMNADPEFLRQYKSNSNFHASIIEKTLDSYGLRVRVVEVNYFPNGSIEYCLEIVTGTKLEDIEKRRRELALALASSTGSVDIQAPIPGRALVGITVPMITAPQNMEISSSKSEYPQTILGKMVNIFAKIFQIIANILYLAVDVLEHMKNVVTMLLVIILVPTVYIFLSEGNFNLNKNLDYSLVIFITFIVMIGVRRKDKIKDEEKKK